VRNLDESRKVWAFLTNLFIATALLIALPMMMIYFDVLPSNNVVADKQFLVEHPSLTIVTGDKSMVYMGFYYASICIIGLGKLKF
jgi:hypothetical protein